MESNNTNSKKWIIIGAIAVSTFTIGGSIYSWFLRQNKSKIVKNNSDNNAQSIPNDVDSINDFKNPKLEAKISVDLLRSEKIAYSGQFESLVNSKFDFKIEEKNGFYTNIGILSVLEKFYQLKFDDFILLCDRFRRIRRKYLDDMNQYIECGFQYFKSLNKLFTDEFDKLYDYKIIDPKKWALSFGASDIKDEEVNELIFTTIDNWEKKLPSQKYLTKNEFIKIANKEKELLRIEIRDIEKNSKYIKITDNLYEYMIILNSKINDQIHKQFDVENEDILAYSTLNELDPDIKNLENDIEELTDILCNKSQEYLN